MKWISILLAEHYYKHPQGAKITISGKLGEDVKHYQERALKTVLQELQDEKK